MTDDSDDFFDEATGAPMYGVDLPGRPRGRYIFPDPPGYVRPKGARPGFMRMTNLAGAFTDQKRLQNWRERMILLGFRADETLIDELFAQGLESMSPDEAKAWLEAHADRAAKAAGSDIGARRGTARHTMLQVFHEEGIVTGTRSMRMQLASLIKALEDSYLRPLPGWSERRVCNTKLHCIGTLDMGVECMITGQIGILDLKTQGKFWSYLEASGQQYGYDSADWVWEGPPDESGRWVKPPAWNLLGAPGGDFPGKRVALLAHMPQQPGPNQLPVEIHEVSLEYGARVMDHALSNVRLRSIGASVAAGRRIGAKRPSLAPEVDTSAIAG